MLLSPESLAAALDTYNGGNRITKIVSRTPVKMNKKSRITGEDNPFLDKVDHLQERLVMFGCSYENRVNNARLQAGGDDVPYFQAESLWKNAGERVNAYMARHKPTGQLYLVYLQAKRGDKNISLRQEQYIDRETGNLIDKDKLVEFMPPVYIPKKQNEGMPEDSAIVNEQIRTIKIENIISISSIDFERGNFEEVIVVNEAMQQAA